MAKVTLKYLSNTRDLFYFGAEDSATTVRILQKTSLRSVGEVLLRQHFFRAFHDKTDSSNNKVLEANYLQCSEYVQSNRLTLSFEVVTAILGHHGDIPQRDFLILTAVADRSMERFYSTSELVEFAQRFRLPHNDMWVFDSEQSVKGLFHLYDTTRETGLAEDTVAALNAIADVHVSSMYPHTVFQGNILEGIVIRYVPYHDKKKERETLQDLAAESLRILQAVPPETPPSFVLTKDLPSGTPVPPVLTTDLRDISKDVMATGDREKVEMFLTTSLCDILCTSDGNSRRSVHRRRLDNEWTSTFPSVFKQALVNQDLDNESQRILKLIETLDSLGAKVDYRIMKESTSGQPDRWLCIVHVFFDTTHQKFQQKMEPGDMPLFRGFCIELGTEEKAYKMNIDLDTDNEEVPSVDSESQSTGLMLKMKFLPYMVRTFGCRNGLQVIAQRGPHAFTDYAKKQMTKWGISPEAKAKWEPFFSAWGKYAHLCLTEEDHKYSNLSLPKLCDAYYLGHLEHFTRLFENGEIVGEDEQFTSTSTFRGLIFVVGLDSEKADSVADMISEKLGGLVVRKGLNRLTQEDWGASCLSRRVGMVCSATTKDSAHRVRKNLEDCGEAMFAVLVGCDEVSILSKCEEMDKKTMLEGKVEETKEKSLSEEKSTESLVATKRLRGLISSWRKTRFAKLWEIPYDDPLNGLVGDDASEALTEGNGVLQKLLDELSEASAALKMPDDRPGLFVFFPSIPGSGKSTLCSKEVEEDLGRVVREADEAKMKDKDDVDYPARPVIVRISDETKKKYWTVVKTEKMKYPSSVYIADKNAPPAGWTNVAQVCSISSGVAAPVLPDAPALQTTSVKGAGEYPFSLHFLAVCMARVLERPPESHSGKLDKSTDLACMIVVKFYSLYRGIAADELFSSMERAIQRGGAMISSSPICIPFFARDSLPELPSELEDALTDALRIQVRKLDVIVRDWSDEKPAHPFLLIRHFLLQYEYDARNDENLSREDEQVAEIESRLRTLLVKHSAFLMSLAADPAVSKEAFVSQVADQVAELSSSTDDSNVMHTAADFVKVASIDVSQASVHSALKTYSEKEPLLLEWLENVAGVGNEGMQSPSVEGMIAGTDFVSDTHVTMVHCSQLPQSTIRNQFEPLVGCAVDVTVTGILWNEQVAAFAVQVASSTKDKPDVQVPAPKNVFPHITLWHQPDISAAYSNELPNLVEIGKAKRIDFVEEPIVIQGVVSLWGKDRA